MITVLPCAAGLVALLAASSAANLPTSVTVVLIPGGRYSPLALGEMSHEAGNILKSSGITFDWRLGADTQVFEEPLVVVKLNGQCDMEGPMPHTGRGPFGWTHSVDGSLLPFSELACDNIRHAVQSAMRQEDYTRREALLGRAMGRVLAHELYHILGATFRHGRDGIAQPALSAAQLISDRLELQPADAEVIQNRLHDSTTARCCGLL